MQQRDLSVKDITLTKFALWASEVIFDREVRFVSEVSPDGEVMGKLNFTWCSTNFTVHKLHFCVSKKLH